VHPLIRHGFQNFDVLRQRVVVVHAGYPIFTRPRFLRAVGQPQDNFEVGHAYRRSFHLRPIGQGDGRRDCQGSRRDIRGSRSAPTSAAAATPAASAAGAATRGHGNPFLQSDDVVLGANSFHVAGNAVALGAAAGAIEIGFAGLGVSGLGDRAGSPRY